MLWAVQFKWPSGGQFIFNCYRHWATLTVRNMDGSGRFFRVAQVGPLNMIAYGTGIITLICDIHALHPHVTQP